MSYFADCRRDTTYNQKYVGEKDKLFLRGFDWAVEMVVDNFFDNEMFGLQMGDGYFAHYLNHELPEDMKEEYVMEYTDGRPDEVRKVKTYADLVRMKLLEWIEMDRNELITSMIDDLSEEEYGKIKAEVDGQSKDSD